MTFAVHGLAVARGIAIGRAVLVASSRVDVAHYFIQPEQVPAEIERVRQGRNAVVENGRRSNVAPVTPHTTAPIASTARSRVSSPIEKRALSTSITPDSESAKPQLLP